MHPEHYNQTVSVLMLRGKTRASNVPAGELGVQINTTFLILDNSTTDADTVVATLTAVIDTSSNSSENSSAGSSNSGTSTSSASLASFYQQLASSSG